jgi:hypothetical protein
LLERHAVAEPDAGIGRYGRQFAIAAADRPALETGRLAAATAIFALAAAGESLGADAVAMTVPAISAPMTIGKLMSRR